MRDIRGWLAEELEESTHQGFPVVEGKRVLGVLTRRDFLGRDARDDAPAAELVRRPPVVAYPKSTLREAADQMVRAKVGRLPVVDPRTGALVGIVSRSDLLAAHERRLEAVSVRRRGIGVR